MPLERLPDPDGLCINPEDNRLVFVTDDTIEYDVPAVREGWQHGITCSVQLICLSFLPVTHGTLPHVRLSYD